MGVSGRTATFTFEFSLQEAEIEAQIYSLEESRGGHNTIFHDRGLDWKDLKPGSGELPNPFLSGWFPGVSYRKMLSEKYECGITENSLKFHSEARFMRSITARALGFGLFFRSCS